MYKYKIVCYDEDENKNINYYGIVAAENFAEAIKKLIKDFGEIETLEISVSWITNNPYIVFTKDITGIDNFIEKID